MKTDLLARTVQFSAPDGATLPVLNLLSTSYRNFGKICAEQKSLCAKSKTTVAALISTNIVVILFFVSTFSASAASRIHYKYNNLFRQMFERAYFLEQAGAAFYFPFHTPMCRRLSDNKKRLNVSIDGDIANFLTYIFSARQTVGDDNKFVQNFRNFIENTTCDPFYIDLTEQALSEDKKTIQYSISYYREIQHKTVQDALLKLEKPYSKLLDLKIDSRIIDILHKRWEFEKRDALLEIPAWSSLGVEKIWIEKTQCDSVFNECTSIVNIRVASTVADIGD